MIVSLRVLMVWLRLETRESCEALLLISSSFCDISLFLASYVSSILNLKANISLFLSFSVASSSLFLMHDSLYSASILCVFAICLALSFSNFRYFLFV